MKSTPSRTGPAAAVHAATIGGFRGDGGMVVDEPGGAFGSQRGSSTANSQPPSGTLRREIVPRWCSAALGNGEAESGARGWPERDRHLEEQRRSRVHIAAIVSPPVSAPWRGGSTPWQQFFQRRDLARVGRARSF